MRTILRALLLVVVVLVVGFFAFGWWTGATIHRAAERPAITSGERPTATTGTVDTTKARERGAEIGQKTAEAAAKVEETAADAAVTAKIKAKMALDDNVRARSIDVSTNGTTVTLSGTVRSDAERERAVRLARETSGVTNVIDRLDVQPR